MKCANCGKDFPLYKLDSKPRRLKGVSTTWKMVYDAADKGDDFDILECQTCYGPAWQQGHKE